MHTAVEMTLDSDGKQVLHICSAFFFLRERAIFPDVELLDGRITRYLYKICYFFTLSPFSQEIPVLVLWGTACAPQSLATKKS